MKLVRTHSDNIDFMCLVKKLDAYLKSTDGEEHDFYHQFNAIDLLKQVVIVYIDDLPVGCGAIKKMDEVSAEVKRMYVSPEYRRKGIAQKILAQLEVWAKELGYKNCILETGKRQVEAVNFYKKCNYKQIKNYGQYKEMQNSICFKKKV